MNGGEEIKFCFCAKFEFPSEYTVGMVTEHFPDVCSSHVLSIPNIHVEHSYPMESKMFRLQA